MLSFVIFDFSKKCIVYWQERAEKVELEKWRMKEKELQEKMEEDAKDLEKMASRHNTLMAKVEECTKKISDLGSLPQPEMINKYMNLSQKAVSIEQFFHSVKICCTFQN